MSKPIVFDGKEHPVDSKDIAFQIAGREVFKLAFMGAGPALLEPIVTSTCDCPRDQYGRYDWRSLIAESAGAAN